MQELYTAYLNYAKQVEPNILLQNTEFDEIFNQKVGRCAYWLEFTRSNYGDDLTRSREWRRRFWWLKDREAMLQFRVVWDAGICNLADRPAEHRSAQHRKLVRPVCLLEDGKSARASAE